MSILQALRYFVHEAFVSLRRSWKVSLLAILTITVSLAIAGLFLLVSTNLGALIEEWERDAKTVIYLNEGLGREEAEPIMDSARNSSFVAEVAFISSTEANERFKKIYSSLSHLLDVWEDDPLPASVEVSLVAQEVGTEAYSAWTAEIKSRAEVHHVDDDRDWVYQLQVLLRIVRMIGLILGSVLLAAAIFTISSVIRLTAYLYREEIEVMRLVGATEFFIRGPFYFEGLLQGLLGGLLAVASLFSGYRLFAMSSSHRLLADTLVSQFLSPVQLLVMVLLGAAAGLFGAVVSLRKEMPG